MHRRPFDTGGDVAERLDILSVADQVFPGLELLESSDGTAPVR